MKINEVIKVTVREKKSLSYMKPGKCVSICRLESCFNFRFIIKKDLKKKKKIVIKF